MCICSQELLLPTEHNRIRLYHVTITVERRAFIINNHKEKLSLSSDVHDVPNIQVIRIQDVTS